MKVNDKFMDDADNCLNNIIDRLTHDSFFVECDITTEYTAFEEDVKDFCDKYIDTYIKNNKYEEAFNSLVRLTDAIVDVEDNMDMDDYYRPVELITYYFAKLLTLSRGAIKNRIHNWMYNYVEEYKDISLIADEYFRVFLEGKMIYHADEYYTNYNDYNHVLSYYVD